MSQRPWRPYLWLISFVSLFVPRRLRTDWKQEWKAELLYREKTLAKWQKKVKFNLLKQSTGSFRDALWLQPRRLEEDMFQDLRFGARMLLKNPRFTLVAVLTIAVSTGASVAVFSLVHAVLIRPLAYKNPDQLVVVWDNFLALNMNRLGVSAPQLFDYQTQNHTFEQLAAFRLTEFNWQNGDQPEHLIGVRVTGNIFSLLGTLPALGRTLVPDDDSPGAARGALLSYEFWQNRFASDQRVLGRTISLDGEQYVVIGVMPGRFQFPYRNARFPERVDVWVPIAFTPEELRTRESYNLNLIARLKPGMTLQQAQIDLDEVVRRLDQQSGYHRGPNGEDPGWKATVAPLDQEVIGDRRPMLLALLGAVFLVLAVAYTNAANLHLARALGRQKEFAVRAALGASLLRLLRQLLTESMLLALVAGALGLLLAYFAIRPLVSLSPSDIPRLQEVSIDTGVIAFTLAVSLLAGIVFGLVPALEFFKLDLNKSLKDGSRGGTLSRAREHLRSALVVGEVALSVVLLVGAGLLLRSFVYSASVDPGFNPQNVLAFDISLPRSAYPQAQAWGGYYRQVIDRLNALPGVSSASMVSSLPLDLSAAEAPFSIEGRPYDPHGTPPLVRFQSIDQNYFRTIGIPVLQGRELTREEVHERSRAVIVNEALARVFFPDAEPLGKRVKLGASSAPGPWLEIVGVAGDVRSMGLTAEAMPEMYLPYVERPRPLMTVVMRTAADPTGFVTSAGEAIHSIDKNQPVYHVRTMQQAVDASLAERRFAAALLAGLALVGLLLAVTGLYGVVSYWVVQRTREIGIRLALGAQRKNVLSLVVGRGLMLSGIGVILGIIGALVLARLIASMLYGVSPTDPSTMIGIGFLMMAVAGLASFLPARRATKVDPNVALRYE